MERGLDLPQADPRPKGPRTGHSVEGCYAAALADCDGCITDEHFVSHRMLKMLAGGENKPLKVQGIDPKNPSLERRVGTKHLIAPVLCERHNKALKPIDTAGNRFFEAVASLGKWLDEAPGGTESILAINGHDLERWCLKALCGFLARAGKPVPELWVRVLFGHGSILPPRGLYVYAEVGDVLAGNALRVEEVTYRGEGSIGVIIHMLNHELVFSMSPHQPIGIGDRHVAKWRVQRPEGFTFTNQANGSHFILWLSWQDSLHHAAINSDWSPTPPTSDDDQNA